MKNLFFLAVIVVVVVSIPMLVKAEEEISLGTYVSAQLWTRTLCDDGILSGDNQALQVDLYQEIGGGFALEAWFSFDTSNAFGGEQSEGDYFLHWTSGDDIFPSSIIVTAGLGYLDISNLYSQTGEDIIQNYLGFKKNFEFENGWTLTPFIKGEFNFYANNGEGYTFLYTGLKSSVTVLEKITLENGLKASFDLDGNYADSGVIAIYEGRVGYAITDSISIDFLVKASAPIYKAEDRDEEIVAGIGISMSF